MFVGIMHTETPLNVICQGIAVILRGDEFEAYIFAFRKL